MYLGKTEKGWKPRCSCCFCKAVVLTIPWTSWNGSCSPRAGEGNHWPVLGWKMLECSYYFGNTKGYVLASSSPCVSVRVSQKKVNSEGCGKLLGLPIFTNENRKRSICRNMKLCCWGMLLGQGLDADVAVGQRTAECWGALAPLPKAGCSFCCRPKWLHWFLGSATAMTKHHTQVCLLWDSLWGH